MMRTTVQTPQGIFEIEFEINIKSIKKVSERQQGKMNYRYLNKLVMGAIRAIVKEKGGDYSIPLPELLKVLKGKVTVEQVSNVIKYFEKRRVLATMSIQGTTYIKYLGEPKRQWQKQGSKQEQKSQLEDFSDVIG